LLKPADCSAVPVHGELSTDDAVSVEDLLFSCEPSLQTTTIVHIGLHLRNIEKLVFRKALGLEFEKHKVKNTKVNLIYIKVH